MKFASFDLKKDLVFALEKLGYHDATKVQDIVIPKALKKENIVVQSETGSGKSHCFIIPILNNIVFNNKVQAIIISPTRELARQTYNFINEFKKYFLDLSCKLFISGQDQSKDIDSIKNGCQIIVSTPGRLNFLKQYLNKNNSDLKTLVLDEADMLFDKTFVDIIDEIISPYSNLQLEVYSATINKQIEQFLRKYIGADYVITMSEKDFTSHTVKHYAINTKHRNLFDCIYDFIKIKNPYLLMIFSNSKDETRKVYDYLNSKKLKCGLISGDLQPRERKSMLRRINDNEFQIICCTDLASRGLDIDNVTDVLSLDLPNNLEYYYHRAGRSGRNYKSGNSYVFCTNDSQNKFDKLESSGLVFEYLKFGENEFVEEKRNMMFKNKPNIVNKEMDKDIRKAASEAKSKKVKPNYKKKIKRAVDNVKKKYRKQAIKKNIRKNLDKYYRGGNHYE